ncbi:MAG: dTDP-4-dehydrorhamnose 3,5-epimerase [Dehalococcoidia bacterium]
MLLRFQRTELPEVAIIEPRVFADERGFFMETYRQSQFATEGIPGQPVQDNYSHSRKGVLRGLHYQKRPKAQGKLIMAVRGEIFDVAVDIRKGSPAYGKWIGATLSSENHLMLYVPPGFAHGFAVISDEADVVYQVTGAEYAPEMERGIIWNDPQIGIQWPIEKPVLSTKDASLPPLKDADNDFVYQGTG